MKVSVVVPTYNQWPRTELVLTSLRCQTFLREDFEVIVVNDASTDETGERLREFLLYNWQTVDLPENRGLFGARNAGIYQAQGELVVFLDGDALPHPDLLSAYWRAYSGQTQPMYLCGYHFSIPSIEFFKNPQTGELFDMTIPGIAREYFDRHWAELVVTKEMVENDFDRVHQKAVEGGYPFPALKMMQDQIAELLEKRRDSCVGWLGLVPHNAAVPRWALEETGGFDEENTFCEGWELAYRLQCADLRPLWVKEAMSYHLYHYHAFSEPANMRRERAIRQGAIDYIAKKYGDARIKLIHFWFASIWQYSFFPDSCIVRNLLDFDWRYTNLTAAEWEEYEAILRHHPDMLSA